jgi:hypothetical protein
MRIWNIQLSHQLSPRAISDFAANLIEASLNASAGKDHVHQLGLKTPTSSHWLTIVANITLHFTADW